MSRRSRSPTRLAAPGQHRAGADRGLRCRASGGSACIRAAPARARCGSAMSSRCRCGRRRTGSACRPIRTRAGENRPAARLGGAREFQRPALAGRRADPAVRQPGDVPPGSLRKLLRARPTCRSKRATGYCRRPTPAPSRGGAGRAARQGGSRRPVAASTFQARARGGVAEAAMSAAAAPPPAPPPPAPAAPIDAAQVSEQRDAGRLHRALQGHRRGRAKPDAAAARPRAAGAARRSVPAGGERIPPARRDRDDQRQRRRIAARRPDALSAEPGRRRPLSRRRAARGVSGRRQAGC